MSGLTPDATTLCKHPHNWVSMESCTAVLTLMIIADMPTLHAESALANLRRPWNKWLPRRYSSLCTKYSA